MTTAPRLRRTTAPSARRRRAAWGEWFALTRQTWIGVSSAAVFLAVALVLAVTPVPFVLRSPGAAEDLLAAPTVDGVRRPVVEILGAPSYDGPGQLQVVELAVTPPAGFATLPEALLSHWGRARDTLPRDLVYDPASTVQGAHVASTREQEQAEEAATVAGLRAAGLQVDPLPVITSVTTAGPAYERLRVGDFVLRVGGRDVARPEDVYGAIAGKKVNEVLSFTVVRAGREITENVTVVAANDETRGPSVGVKIELGYRHGAQAAYHLPDSVDVGAAGLMLALAVYERASSGTLVAGRRIAGAGTVDARGVVGPVTGIGARVGAAEEAKAQIMLVPAQNCRDLAGLDSAVRIVPVATVTDAINALNHLTDSTTATEVPRCP